MVFKIERWWIFSQYEFCENYFIVIIIFYFFKTNTNKKTRIQLHKHHNRLKFRNYLPQDNGLKNSIIERPQIPRLTEEITQKLNQVAGVDPDYMVSIKWLTTHKTQSQVKTTKKHKTNKSLNKNQMQTKCKRKKRKNHTTNEIEPDWHCTEKSWWWFETCYWPKIREIGK